MQVEDEKYCRHDWALFTMHDLVHDLAISLLGNQILDQSKQGNTRGSSCQYALLTDFSKPLESFMTSPATLIALRFLDRCRTEPCGAVFAPAMSLRVLDLSKCFLWKLPDSIGQLKLLRYLKVPGIRDKMFPECITKLSNLIYLNLHRSSIVTLPDSIGELESLMYLDLSNCYNLNELPVTFRNLEKLVHLDLSNSPLRNQGKLVHPDLSKSLECMSRLEHLNLSREPEEMLTGLPKLLVNLTKLRYLNLKRCLVSSERDSVLECIFCNLSNLEHLDLSGNDGIYEIQETLGYLRKLHTLNLSYCNKLKCLPDSISGMETLKYLDVSGCYSLDDSELPQYRKRPNLLPKFVVNAGDIESTSSNLWQVEYENPPFLEITKLEKVKSAEEAQRIKLVEKQNMRKLHLVWTQYAKRFVDDMELLKQLLPSDAVEEFLLQGYNGVSIPSWMMDITTYLPHLNKVVLEDLPSCNKLPPLGQLPNLTWLDIRGMKGIRKIDRDLYGGTSAFPRLVSFHLQDMECLEEWNTSYCQCEEGLNHVVFPKLEFLDIWACPELKLTSGSPLCNYIMQLSIIGSDKIIIQSPLEDRGHVGGVSYFGATTILEVNHCEAPLHQWSLLRNIPYLKVLRIGNCSDLTCSSADILQGLSSLMTLYVVFCESIVALPEWLGDLTSLVKLEVCYCEGIKTLPESIQELKCLQCLNISGCSNLVALPEGLGDLTSLVNLKVHNCEGIKTLPESIQQLKCLQCLEISVCSKLVQWCKSWENKTKLVHIEEIVLDGVQLSVTGYRSQLIFRGSIDI